MTKMFQRWFRESAKVNFIITFSLFITACSDSQNQLIERPGTPTTQGKPLPVKCLQDLPVRLRWKADPVAYAYIVEVGIEPGVHSKIFSVDGNQKAFPIGLERGTTYYFKATKYFKTGAAARFQTVKVTAPTCAERESHQKAYPDYTEPFEQFLGWTNK